MVKRALVLLVALGCRGDGRSPERSVPTAEPASTAGSAQIPPAPAGSAEPPPATATPAQPPPGDAKLVPVPAAVASKVKLEQVMRGLARPVLLVVAPGDARKRWFILEQHAGRIRIVENGKLLPKAFLAIKVSTGNEQGLLGLAFHPNYATNGKLYINYTGEDEHTRIVEYKVSATNPDQVDAASRRELAKIEQPYSNHNGGHVVFGPDGKLYTGMGDGGSAGDPERNGQNPDALLGKILRFDVDAAQTVPERVHMGVRNPWRFSFDAKTGDLMIADVGQNAWEYVFAVRGEDKDNKNFGWNVVEGNHCFRKKTCDKSGFTLPVVEYSHEEGCSITGGFTYRGKALPMLDGRYFYSDFCTGLLRSFVFTQGVVREHWDWKAAIDKGGDISQISSFGVDHDGELYLVMLTGSIYRLAPAR